MYMFHYGFLLVLFNHMCYFQIMSRWETEYAPFYKKGITALDRIKLLESFVLHMYDKMLPFQEVSVTDTKHCIKVSSYRLPRRNRP